MRSFALSLLLGVGCLWLVSAPTAGETADKAEAIEQQKEALAKLQTYVGQWRGVGQPRRGSSRGSWLEEAQWEWHFDDDRVALRFAADKAKYFKSGRVEALDSEGKYRLTVKLLGDKADSIVYAGTLQKDGRLVLAAEKPAAELPARISIRQVAGGNRLLVLYERKVGTSKRFLRLAEVGYTRKGSNFGKGTSYVECVVTGGKGTIPVTFQGKTYYVCCGGCRDYFNENPAEVLAEYRARKEEEKDKAKKDG